jgi:site-specific recombinase XerD
MNAASYLNVDVQNKVLLVVGLLILLKYGLSGLIPLRRALSAEELQQVCNDHRLVTAHLARGIFLPYPLTQDIRVGHVILDDIRHYFWQYAAHQNQAGKSQPWGRGPRGWEQMLVNIIEQALAAPVYEYEAGILSRRPETEGELRNPWLIAHKGELTDTGYALLPEVVQEQFMTYLTYCHREQRLEIVTLSSRGRELMYFFTWVRRQGKLAHYPHWTRETAQEIFRAYASCECAELEASTRQVRLLHLAHFFATLADLGHIVPAGYRLLYMLGRRESTHPRSVPREEIMDRVFRDGVCRLAYDPLSRLALTIQYYCGTRVTETCDLHLFCILEDRDGHAYLLIPRGKSKEERPFPIVELGMGPLLEYMDEIIALRLTPDGASRTLGKTNFRYLHDDPERARDWHYLFDRVPRADGGAKTRGRLSKTRVEAALKEALLLAAQMNPDGFFRQGIYHSTCQHQRRKGQRCFYFAAKAGITTCPRCGSSLSGKLGARCYHILEEDFVCDGEAQNGEAFCPKCETPLGEFLPITTHVFRHNSVSRAHRAGVSVAQNMKLHGHKTLSMHLRYLHLLLEDTTNEVRQIFAEKRLRDVRQMLGSSPGQIIEGGIAYSISLEQYLGLTLQRTLKRRTYGIWGGFWAGALAQRGVASPLTVEDEIVIPEDTYEHTVAQYWYEALGLAVSEMAFEHVTNKRWRAEVPAFLDRQKIEALVQFHLRHITDSLSTALGQRLMETDILEQRRFLDDLAEKLRPWWQHMGTIDQLVEMFTPGGGYAFQKQLPPAESEA